MGRKSCCRRIVCRKRRRSLNTVIAAEPDNDQATVLLAQSLLSSDAERALSVVEPIDLGSKHLEAAEAIRTLASLYGYLDDDQALPDESVRDEYLTAVSSAKANDLEGALDGFVQVVRKNRYYDDDGSRKACLAIFSLLGDQDELTRRYRRALSNALY